MFQIRFLGGKLGSALAKEFEASTVSDLLYVSVVIIYMAADDWNSGISV